GEDRLVRQLFGNWRDRFGDGHEEDERPTDESSLRSYLDQMPLSPRARRQLFEMYWSDRDVLAGHTTAQRQSILERTSYRDFLLRYWHADDDVVKFLQCRTHDLFAIGIDAVPPSEMLSLPGLKAQRAALAGVNGGAEEPYI